MLRKIISVHNVGRFRSSATTPDPQPAKHTMITGANAISLLENPSESGCNRANSGAPTSILRSRGATSSPHGARLRRRWWIIMRDRRIGVWFHALNYDRFRRRRVIRRTAEIRAQSRHTAPSHMPPTCDRGAFRLSQAGHSFGAHAVLADEPTGFDASRLAGATALSGLAAPSPPSRVASRPPVSIPGANTLRLFRWRGAADALCRSASHSRTGRGV